MLAVNYLAVIAVTAIFARYCRRRGWSMWWAVAAGLTPGLVMATLRDLSDPLAVTAMLGGLLAWEQGWRWRAGGLLALAVLAREPMTLAVVAIAADAAACWWRRRTEPAALRRAVEAAAPAVISPAAAYIGWQIYIHTLDAPGAGTGGAPVLPPFRDFVVDLGNALGYVPRTAVWDWAYVLLVLAGMACSVALLRRGINAATMAAVLFSVSLTVIVFGDEWGISRYAAPLLVTLLLAGLRQRSRIAVAIPVAAAVLTVLVPLAIPSG